MIFGLTEAKKFGARFCYSSKLPVLKALIKGMIHDYASHTHGVDYIFEWVDSNREAGYMTGQGKGLRCGDYITLKNNNIVEHYQIEQIDYYENPSDLWIALVSKTSQR